MNSSLLIIILLLCVTVINAIFTVIIAMKLNQKMQKTMDNGQQGKSITELLEVVVNLLTSINDKLEGLAKMQQDLTEALLRKTEVVAEQEPTVQPLSFEQPVANVEENPQLVEPSVAVTEYPTRPKESDGMIILEVVADEYRKQAPFIVEAKEDYGEYYFNEQARDRYLGYVDSGIKPYADCSLKAAGSPQQIVTKR